jgi:UTP--glucose-1-phosphate uridylyltransferase
VTIENFNKLPRPFQEYSRKLLEMGQKVKFAIQPMQDGLGHAVYSAREMIGNEPFLLMLGDHIYRSDSDRSCAQQLVDAFNQHGISVIGVRQTPENMLAHFGTASGYWMEQGKLLNLTEFAEKPTVEYARDNLRVEGIPDDEYLTVFGQYIIKPQVFDYLEEHVHHNVRERGEFQLTSALDRLRKEDGFLGLVIDGKRYDIGMPDYYLDTLQAFRSD